MTSAPHIKGDVSVPRQLHPEPGSTLMSLTPASAVALEEEPTTVLLEFPVLEPPALDDTPRELEPVNDDATTALEDTPPELDEDVVPHGPSPTMSALVQPGWSGGRKAKPASTCASTRVWQGRQVTTVLADRWPAVSTL